MCCNLSIEYDVVWFTYALAHPLLSTAGVVGVVVIPVRDFTLCIVVAIAIAVPVVVFVLFVVLSHTSTFRGASVLSVECLVGGSCNRLS